MRAPTTLEICSVLCEKEPMQQGSRHQRRRRSKTSWSSISKCDGSVMRSNTSLSSLSTCDGLSDSSRCSEADSENGYLSFLAVRAMGAGVWPLRPAPGLPVQLAWIEFARALKAQQGIPQQVCSVHVEPAPVPNRADKQKPFKKHHFVTYFPLYDPQKHQAFDLIQRIIGKKAEADSKGSCNMKAIYTLGNGIKIQVQGAEAERHCRGVKRAQIGWPHGYEVEELHIYCACPSEELKVKAIAKLCEILDRLSDHFHKFCRKLGGEKIEYNRSEPFYIIVEAGPSGC